MRVEIEKICVYLHSVDGKVFYVGMGIADRPLQIAGRHRSARWHEIVDRAGHFNVEIVGWFKSEDDARKEEYRQIKIHYPYANIAKSTKIPGRRYNKRSRPSEEELSTI